MTIEKNGGKFMMPVFEIPTQLDFFRRPVERNAWLRSRQVVITGGWQCAGLAND